MSRLLHYSSAPLVGALRSRAEELSVEMKPAGLWVSAEGSWKEWCESERFSLDRLRCVSEIVLRPGSDILRISSAIGIDRLHQEFSAEWRPDAPLKGYTLDWRRIGERYDGIIIAPYQWSRRLDGPARWYYGWDCASGCIWEPRAVAEVRQLGSA